jgi:shikimate kinase
MTSRCTASLPEMTEPSPTRVVLVGMMGSGKSSVGRALAERTGWPFVDNDVLVERATGRTARQLLAEAGEGAMREAEASALRTGLTLVPPVIVATAAGTVLDPETRPLIGAAGFAVWLRAPAETLAARAAGAEHRPWLDGDALGWFRTALAAREPLYASITDLEVDTGSSTPGAAADAILAALPAGA